MNVRMYACLEPFVGEQRQPSTQMNKFSNFLQIASHALDVCMHLFMGTCTCLGRMNASIYGGLYVPVCALPE